MQQIRGWVASVAAALAVACSAMAGQTPGDAPGTDPHAHHRQAMTASSTARVERRSYVIPDVTLVDADGRRVPLRELMSDGRPLAVNFIFTTCTSICPVMTATMVQMQREIADQAVQPTYVSISIDPEFDTASVLKDYAAQQGAGWTFLTGTHDDVVTVLRAFDAYRGNKMNHAALTLLRAPGAGDWTRVEGLTSARELAKLWQSIAT